MQPIPLVRARYASGFVTSLRERGAPVERYLEQAHLPIDLLENADGLISAFSLWSFAGDAARDTGIRDLGLAAGAAPVAAHGEFGTKVIYAPTLYGAINTFCSEARTEYSRADFYLTRDADTAWFCRGPIDGTAEQVQQVELYVLMLMLQTLRMTLGMDWDPIRLRLQNSDVPGLADTEMIRNTEVEFGCRYSGIAFPISSLGLPLRISDATASAPPVPAQHSMESTGLDDPIQILRDLLGDYLRHRPPTINAAAEMTGTSARTLQRRLMLQGLTFTRLIEEVRFEQARSLLTDPRIKITDIAFELGYSHVAHFTRAFRRIAGIPPREFRAAHHERKGQI
jgi:AraC-like DNA-binding protein